MRAAPRCRQPWPASRLRLEALGAAERAADSPEREQARPSAPLRPLGGSRAARWRWALTPADWPQPARASPRIRQPRGWPGPLQSAQLRPRRAPRARDGYPDENLAEQAPNLPRPDPWQAPWPEPRHLPKPLPGSLRSLAGWPGSPPCSHRRVGVAPERTRTLRLLVPDSCSHSPSLPCSRPPVPPSLPPLYQPGLCHSAVPCCAAQRRRG